MVSSGTVTSDSSTMQSLFGQYTSQMSMLTNNVWQGKSKDNAIEKSDAFVDEYKSTLASQMESFASALNEYETYKSAKSNYETASYNYNNATTDEDKNSYKNSRDNYYNKMQNSKSKITEYLSDVTSKKLSSASNLIENNPSLFTFNEFVFYSQGDYNQAYGYSGTIASSGCGPTSMAMVLTYLTGESITPVDTAAYSVQHGYRCEGNGTYEGLFPAMAEEYGLNCEQQSYSASNIINSLSEGNVIIAHMGAGHFTSGGHYIVLKGLDEDGNVVVADPNGGRCNGSWDVNTIVNEAVGSMYSISN